MLAAAQNQQLRLPTVLLSLPTLNERSNKLVLIIMASGYGVTGGEFCVVNLAQFRDLRSKAQL